MIGIIYDNISIYSIVKKLEELSEDNTYKENLMICFEAYCLMTLRDLIDEEADRRVKEMDEAMMRQVDVFCETM